MWPFRKKVNNDAWTKRPRIHFPEGMGESFAIRKAVIRSFDVRTGDGTVIFGDGELPVHGFFLSESFARCFFGDEIWAGRAVSCVVSVQASTDVRIVKQLDLI